jgi:short-subunit dehydrogenase
MENTDQFDSGSTTLITGASSGIGYELAKVFARNGHNLVLVARNRQRLDQLADELREKADVMVKVIPKDLSIGTSAQEIFDELQRESVQLDILFNNAGLVTTQPPLRRLRITLSTERLPVGQDTFFTQNSC